MHRASPSLGWTPRSRFQAALRGEMPDRVPFVIWNNKLPGGALTEALLDAGACVIVKSAVYDVALAIVARSPAYYATIEANISVDIVGIDRFRRYYLPLVEEACDILHAAGVLAGAHLDDKNRTLALHVAGTHLDYIESFTPPPDCDLTVAEARCAWPGKALYVNFPSSFHHRGSDAVRTVVS